jgi:hypothetical protein
LRIWRIFPLNVRDGYASTVKVASMSAFSLPMSASATLVSTCILVRSSAIRNSVGADSDAATVCPTSTLREMTTPVVGDTIVV